MFLCSFKVVATCGEQRWCPIMLDFDHPSRILMPKKLKLTSQISNVHKHEATPLHMAAYSQ